MPRMAPSNEASMLTWAKWWVSEGWTVFPVLPREKNPVTQNGFKDATQDIEQLELWWGRNPEYNIGGVPPVDMFVVDVDVETDIEFPGTWEHSTSESYKRHLVYRQNPLNVIPHGQKIWPGIDTRCHGKGYIVLPGSVHPNGVQYRIKVTRPAEMFPTDIKPTKAPRVRKGAEDKPKANGDVLEALAFEGVDGTGRDDTMIKIAGYLARYVPDKDVYAGILHSINRGWADPLDDSALNKKVMLFDRHAETLIAKAEKVLDDEARGWLVERTVEGAVGYDTPIEGRDGTVTFMPVTDFTMRATGVIVSPGFAKRVFIVDISTAKGETLVGQKIDTDIMCDSLRLRKWLARRGCNAYDHKKDPRLGSLGSRLIKLLDSQEPITLESRDHYGWCAETKAFLVEQGEVTPDGLRGFTNVYPDDRLRTDSPTAFKFDSDDAQAREWLSRVLALQPEREAAKVGAWAMMLLLRGQWTGLMPGLLVQASAGTGKTRFFQLLFKLLGSTNEGEALTVPAMRDKLLGNMSNAVWLDDVHLDDRQQQLMRGALTNGKLTLKTQGMDGWETVEKHMRASIVVSGEGVEWYRQKALRDRFIEVEFDKTIRTTDADKLVTEDIGKASGALLMLVLRAAHKLPELEAHREGIKAREEHARATLRMGAEILDEVLGTGAKWARIISDWDRAATKDDLGQASENVLYVLPTIWSRLKHPRESGVGSEVNPVWYDELTKTFWVHAQLCADYAVTKMRLDDRQKQLCSQAGITRELDACGAGPSVSKPTRMIGGTRKATKYRQLPAETSAHVLSAVDMLGIDDDES